MDLQSRYEELLVYLGRYEVPLVALSGGVDSSFLLAALKESKGPFPRAVTVQSPYIPQIEITRAREVSAFLGVPLTLIEIDRIPEPVRENPEDRCYRCKSIIFRRIGEEAEKLGAGPILDGTNADDMHSHRPGLKALKELRVESPLAACGMTKADIREMSRRLQLPTADLPSCSCLLTRFPYNTYIHEDSLRMAEEAETFIHALGVRQVRVRVHGEIARIEVGREERNKLFAEDLLDRIHSKLTGMGFGLVTLDIYGFRSGSMDSHLKEGTRR